MAMISIFSACFLLLSLEALALTCESLVLHVISSWFKAAMEIGNDCVVASFLVSFLWKVVHIIKRNHKANLEKGL